MARFVGGWIKLWRKALESDLFDNVYLWATWHALLYMATWKPSKILWNGKQREIPPGTVVFSPRELADRFDCSKSVIQKWLRYLHDTQRIVLETSPAGTIATICNWEIYQGREEEESSPRTHDDATACSPRVHGEALSEEDKKERREEENNPVRSRAPSFDLEAAYKKYPLKQGKTPGLNKLRKQIRTQEDYNALVLAIARYSESKKVKEGFILNFSTFAGQWRDWLAEDAGTSVQADSGEYQGIEADLRAVRGHA